ncbi:hypothetical protein ScPMuIL_010059 [Solemya velum]
MNLPQLFLDTALTASTYFRLSTSQVPTSYEAVMFFGPVVPDGYGVCYNPRESQILFGVSSYNNCPDTEAYKLVGSLESSLCDMQAIMQGNVSAKL